MPAREPSPGRRALITGGGSGIGAVTGRLLATKGWRIAIIDLDGACAERTSSEIGADKTIWRQGDVADPKVVDATIDAMVATWGGIDDLVNNAGIWDHAPLADLTLERWQRVFDVNLFAAISASNTAVRHMKPGSAIVNVSSVLGQVAAPTRGPYCVSKSALISLTKVQAIEWAERGIRVNAIAPGYISNPTTLEFAAKGGVDVSAINRRTPMGRFGTEEEVAEGILFLLEPERASYITGHTLEVNGGWTAYDSSSAFSGESLPSGKDPRMETLRRKENAPDSNTEAYSCRQKCAYPRSGRGQAFGGICSRKSMIVGFNHTSFTVTDMDRSVRFWTEKLGFEAASVSPRSGQWQEQVTGVPGAALMVAHLYGHGQHIEFVQYLTGALQGRAPSPAAAAAAHVCLEVDDIAGTWDDLIAAGATPQGEITNVETGPVKKCKAAYLRDPSGIIIELLELMV